MQNYKRYAVKRGHVPGVYSRWHDAKKQIEGFYRPVWKGFDDLVEAEAFAGVKARRADIGPYVEVREGNVVKRFAFTDKVRAALHAAGVDILIQ